MTSESDPDTPIKPSTPIEPSTPFRPERLLQLATDADAANLSKEGHGEDHDMDPNDVAALVGGHLSDAMRETIERRVAASPDDRQIVAAVADGMPPATAARDARRLWWLPMSAAALVLVALGLAWALQFTEYEDPLGDNELAQAFSDLRGNAPETFGSWEPLLVTERSAPPQLVRRGGLAVHAPVGAFRSTPPEIRWTPIDGADGYVVHVLSDEGAQLLRQRQLESVLPWPADSQIAPGTECVATVSTVVGGVRARGNTTFAVLSEQARQQYDAALKQIQSVEPPGLRPILAAQVAIRMKLYTDASQILDDAQTTTRNEKLLAEMRDYVAGATGTEARNN